MKMSERMSTGSNKPGSFPQYNTSSSSSGNGLIISFSASEEEELEGMLNCLPPDRSQMMDGWIRRFVTTKVKEEILLSQKKPLTSMDRNIEDQIYNYESRSLELRFSNEICSPILTKENIKGEGCEPLRLSLFDSYTGEEVKSGPRSSDKVQIFVLEVGFDSDGGDSGTHDEFDKKVVGEVEGKKSLLVGNVYLNLINGTGLVPDIYFKSNACWMKNSCFRLGARIVDNSNGIRVKEAMTKPFDVKDKREKLYKSHDIPSLSDDVWRLRMIGRNGPVNKRLGVKNINTVKDFLDLQFTNVKMLQEIFKQCPKNLEQAVSHARTCPDKLLYYPSGLERKTGVVFNVSGEVLGLVVDGKFASSNMLSKTEQVLADKSVTCAFKHWGDVIPFEDQKYLARCSSHLSGPSNASLTDDELATPELIGQCMYRQPSNCSEADINELISDDILVFNDSFSYSPDHGLDQPPTLASIVQNIDEIFSSIDAQKPTVNPHPNEHHADTTYTVNAVAAAKAYKSWKMLLFSISFLLRKKCSKSFRPHKKPKLY